MKRKNTRGQRLRAATITIMGNMIANGIMRDAEIADRLGVHKTTVAVYRRKHVAETKAKLAALDKADQKPFKLADYPPLPKESGMRSTHLGSVLVIVIDEKTPTIEAMAFVSDALHAAKGRAS